MGSVTGCLGCTRCEAGPVATLIDGRTVCTWCPDWRAECEARHILAMPSIHDRRAYLADIKTRRGQASHDELADLVRAVWSNARANP